LRSTQLAARAKPNIGKPLASAPFHLFWRRSCKRRCRPLLGDSFVLALPLILQQLAAPCKLTGESQISCIIQIIQKFLVWREWTALAVSCGGEKMHVNSAEAATEGRLLDLTSNFAAACSGHCNCLSCKANFLQHKVLQLSILQGNMLNSPLYCGSFVNRWLSFSNPSW